MQSTVRCWRMEVHRTIKRAALWAFTMALVSLIGISTNLSEHMGIIDGLWREEEDTLDRCSRTRTCGY